MYNRIGIYSESSNSGPLRDMDTVYKPVNSGQFVGPLLFLIFEKRTMSLERDKAFKFPMCPLFGGFTVPCTH